MDAKTRKAIHRDIDNSTIPEEIKLMYLAASACQSVVEVVFKRIKGVYLKHGFKCQENEMLSGIYDYCKQVQLASHNFYARINPQIENATWGIGREDDEEGNIEAYDGFNAASCELVRLMMRYINGTADDKEAYGKVFAMLHKLPSKGVFEDKDISRYKLKV